MAITPYGSLTYNMSGVTAYANGTKWCYDPDASEDPDTQTFPYDAARAITPTIYVDASAIDDTGDGSIGDPYKFVNTAILAASAGDIIALRGGTHSVTELNLKFQGASGSIGSLIELTSYPGEQPVIDCGGGIWLQLQNKNYWRFSHLKLTNYSRGWWVGQDTTADNCEWYAVQGDTDVDGDNVGLCYMQRAIDFSIDKMKCTFIGDPTAVHQNTSGIFILNPNELVGGVINRYEAYNFPNDIYFKHGKGNLTSHTGQITVSNSFLQGGSRNSAGYNQGGVKFDNVIFGTQVNMSEDDGGESGDWNWYEHCTFYGGVSFREQDGGFSQAGAQNNKFNNCLIMDNFTISSSSSVTTDSNYNLYAADIIIDNGTSLSLAAWRAANSSDVNSLEGTPLFEGSDFDVLASYELSIGSAGKGAASDATDIGADITTIGVTA